MRIPDKLTCKEFVELVTDYLEQTLVLEMRVRFEEHAAECPGCQTYIEQVQQTINMLYKLAEEPMLPESKEELLEIFRKWKQS
jgi:predicted anti-sigma-YlaC factor YlaD